MNTWYIALNSTTSAKHAKFIKYNENQTSEIEAAAAATTHIDLVELPLVEHLEEGEPRGGLEQHQHLVSSRLSPLKQTK